MRRWQRLGDSRPCKTDAFDPDCIVIACGFDCGGGFISRWADDGQCGYVFGQMTADECWMWPMILCGTEQLWPRIEGRGLFQRSMCRSLWFWLAAHAVLEEMSGA